MPSGRQAVTSGRQAVAATGKKRAILSFIEQRGRVTAAEAVEHFGLSGGRIRQIFRELVGDGSVEKIGDNRYAYYVLK
jgi:predicted HTH transcriptional regulator